MASEALDIVRKFSDTFGFKFLGQPYVCAGNHKIEPDDDTLLVAELEEIIVGVVSSAPNSEGVIICENGVSYGAVVFFLCDAGGDIVKRDEIRSHGENLHAVIDKAEFASLAVRVGCR